MLGKDLGSHVIDGAGLSEGLTEGRRGVTAATNTVNVHPGQAGAQSPAVVARFSSGGGKTTERATEGTASFMASK